MSSMEHPPYTIELRGQTITLADAEASEISRSLLQQAVARTTAEHAAAEAAGQVWIARYGRHGHPLEETCYSLEEAVEFLEGGEENDQPFGESIRCPDGTEHARPTLGFDWRELLNPTA